jgi:hypothetical protein
MMYSYGYCEHLRVRITIIAVETKKVLHIPSVEKIKHTFYFF